MLAVALNGTLWGEPAGGQLLPPVPAQLAGRPVRAGVPVRGVRAGHGRHALLARADAGHQRRAGDARVPRATPPSAVLRLKYLDGGHGEGCHDEDDAYTLSRRRFHHLTFYGFLLCFAATSVATLYHYLLRPACAVYACRACRSCSASPAASA